MAYDTLRFTENAAGMTGRGGIAIYDGTGNDDQGGDPIADMRSATLNGGLGFFTGQEVIDAIREAAKSDDGRSTFATFAEAKALNKAFKKSLSLSEEGDDDSDGATEGNSDCSVDLGDLQALQGVMKFPVRIKCATLGWNVLIESLENLA